MMTEKLKETNSGEAGSWSEHKGNTCTQIYICGLSMFILLKCNATMSMSIFTCVPQSNSMYRYRPHARRLTWLPLVLRLSAAHATVLIL